jgi:beta-ribofuranosylaminobenzene 5'-phosphate synthase
MQERIVRVTAGSRLHFGMLSFGRPGERQFGGAGAMIAAPALTLSIGESERLEIVGPLGDRAEQFVTRLSHNASWWRPRPCFRITIESAPPPHAGLGSGTQLGMALARGLAAFFHAEPQTAESLARAVGRGKRSAVGIHGATLGGLIIESGKLAEDEISPLVSRVALPDQWRFVVVLQDEAAGLSGEAEQRAFDRLPAVSLDTSAALCRLLMCELAPAALQGDFARFSESLYQYGRLAGQCFAAQQGGVYANPAVERLVERCLELGVRGVGQSSWGPTVFALCPTQNEAEDLVNLLRAASLTDAKMFVAAPDNHGIQVR